MELLGVLAIGLGVILLPLIFIVVGISLIANAIESIKRTLDE